MSAACATLPPPLEKVPANSQPAPDLQWQPNGCLFIAGDQHIEPLRASIGPSLTARVAALWLEPDESGARYPEVHTSGLDDLQATLVHRIAKTSPTVWDLRGVRQWIEATFDVLKGNWD